MKNTLTPSARKAKALSIINLTSTVFYNGRRGMPQPGCDCEQCFGYCLVDDDKRARAAFSGGMGGGPRGDGALDFDR